MVRAARARGVTTFADEINPASALYRDGYRRGLVAMANAGPNTNGSQFFIMHDTYPLPPNYVIFAQGHERHGRRGRHRRDAYDQGTGWRDEPAGYPTHHQEGHDSTVAARIVMKTILCLAALLLPATLLAQWPATKSAAAPRTADGRVNLLAPAPRAADGKPDLSGIWDKGLLPAEVPAPGLFSGAGPGRAFRDLKNAVDDLPLQPWAAELKARRYAQNSKDHPDAHCLPLHPIQLHLHPQPRKIVQTPEVVLIIYEANDGRRQVFMDGRQLPSGEFEPWWYGYSVGRWDGDTLVVESNGFKDQMWIDEYGTPGSDRLRVTERFRRLNFGTLEIQITVDDAKTFTRPFSFTLQQRLMPDTELIEFVCGENNLSAKRLVGN